MIETEQLLREIEAFCAAQRMGTGTFGNKAVNDGKLVKRLRAGGSVGLEKARVIREFIRSREHDQPASQAVA